jgi:hypothetical protein
VKLEYAAIEKRGGIAIVRFDRKASLNAFNEELVVELTYAARSFFSMIWKPTPWSLPGHQTHSPPGSI